MKLVFDIVLLALIYDFSELQVEWFPLRNPPKNIQQFVPFPKVPGLFGRLQNCFGSVIIVTSSRQCCWWRYWQWTPAPLGFSILSTFEGHMREGAYLRGGGELIQFLAKRITGIKRKRLIWCSMSGFALGETYPNVDDCRVVLFLAYSHCR